MKLTVEIKAPESWSLIKLIGRLDWIINKGIEEAKKREDFDPVAKDVLLMIVYPFELNNHEDHNSISC